MYLPPVQLWEMEGEFGVPENPPPPSLPSLFLIALRHLARVLAYGPTYGRARDPPTRPMDHGYKIEREKSPEDGIIRVRDAFLAV